MKKSSVVLIPMGDGKITSIDRKFFNQIKRWIIKSAQKASKI